MRTLSIKNKTRRLIREWIVVDTTGKSWGLVHPQDRSEGVDAIHADPDVVDYFSISDTSECGNTEDHRRRWPNHQWKTLWLYLDKTSKNHSPEYLYGNVLFMSAGFVWSYIIKQGNKTAEPSRHDIFVFSKHKDALVRWWLASLWEELHWSVNSEIKFLDYWSSGRLGERSWQLLQPYLSWKSLTVYIQKMVPYQSWVWLCLREKKDFQRQPMLYHRPLLWCT